MVIQTPTKFFLVSGSSSDMFSPLNAFDAALLASGVGDTNLIKLSSILPPNCTRLLTPPLPLPMGALVPVAYASLTSGIWDQVISSAVAIGVPEDSNLAGLIMEFSDTSDQATVERKVRQMVAKGMELRKRPIKEILSISASSRVNLGHSATFAGVVLWEDENDKKGL